MGENLDLLFRAAAVNCETCYNAGENPNIVSMGWAQQCLNDVMNSYDEKDKNWKLAHNLKLMCDACGFRDSKIKNNLEGCGILI